MAQELVLRHPARVTRLVLACTSSGGEGGASYPLHELEALAPAERAIRAIELGDVRCNETWRRENPKALERALALLAARSSPDADRPEAVRGAICLFMISS